MAQSQKSLVNNDTEDLRRDRDADENAEKLAGIISPA